MSEQEGVSVQMDLNQDGDRLAQGLSGMTGPFGVLDEETDLFGRGRAAHSDGVGDVLEGAIGTCHAELVSYVKFGPDIGLYLFKGYVVEGRKARHLGEQAECGPGDEVLQRGRPQLGSAAYSGFVGFKTEFADAALDMHVLKHLGHGADDVLYYNETKVGANGVRYRVNCYHDLGTGRMHVETITGGGLDIVVVGDEQIMLGEDLVHHVAEWGANVWSVDDSLFNLTQLRHDLQANRAVYEGMDRFEGQRVYRIRWKQGLVLLLDMRYQPVNVLRDARGPGTGQPIYERLTLLPAWQVPSTLWDTNVPPGFQMGRLPERP